MYLERLLVIVETIAAEGPAAAMTVGEIAAATGVPKPSVYRQVNDLVDAGMLEPRANGRYALGLRARRLSGPQAAPDQVKRLATPLLQQAAREHRVVFFLSRLSGVSVEIVHVEVPGGGVSYLHPGIGARPLHACSCGKAIAAFSADATLIQAMSGQLRAYTEHTKTTLADLEIELQTIRTQGYAECVEELERGICSVAAPLRLNQQPARYSLGATGAVRVFSPAFRTELGAYLAALCAALGERLDDEAGARPLSKSRVVKRRL